MIKVADQWIERLQRSHVRTLRTVGAIRCIDTNYQDAGFRKHIHIWVLSNGRRADSVVGKEQHLQKDKLLVELLDESIHSQSVLILGIRRCYVTARFQTKLDDVAFHVVAELSVLCMNVQRAVPRNATVERAESEQSLLVTRVDPGFATHSVQKVVQHRVSHISEIQMPPL